MAREAELRLREQLSKLKSELYAPGAPGLLPFSQQSVPRLRFGSKQILHAQGRLADLSGMQ